VDWKEFAAYLIYYKVIYLEGLRKITESLSVAGLPEIQTGYISNTNAEHYCYAALFDLLLYLIHQPHGAQSFRRRSRNFAYGIDPIGSL